MNRGRRAAIVVPATLPVALAALCAATLVFPRTALAFSDFVGARGLAMGQAGRADARGDQGPLWNPAGMSLASLYTVQGEYGFITRDGGHAVRASVVDSTSAFKLAGGLFYGYRTASPVGVAKFSGHEAGLSLSYPFADLFLVGGTVKYLNMTGGFEPDGKRDHAGITADVGVVARAGSMVTIGVAGYNLRDLSASLAPLSLGYGIALRPTPDLALVADGYHDLTTADPNRGTTTTVSGGAEYVLQHRMVFRLGGGHDGGADHGFLTGGLAVISELGSLDVGVRQDVSGQSKLTFIAAGVRLFVPQP